MSHARWQAGNALRVQQVDVKLWRIGLVITVIGN
jgi:hypothetical protein